MFDQQRPDQRDRGDPGKHDAGHREAEAATLGIGAIAPWVGCDLSAAGGDDDPSREEEDRSQGGDLPEPVEGGADGEGEHRRQQRRIALALGVQVPPARRQRRSRAACPTSARTRSPPTAPSSANASRYSEWASWTGSSIERC